MTQPPEMCAGQAPNALPELTEFDFHRRLAQTPGVSVVLFSSPDCRACRSLEKRLPALLEEAPARLYKVDVQRATALARAYEIFHLPSLLVFVDGHYHGPLQAAPRGGILRQALRALLAAPAEDEP